MSRLTKIWKDRTISKKKNSLKLSSSLSTILLYGAEAWTLHAHKRKKSTLSKRGVGGECCEYLRQLIAQTFLI